MKPLGSLLRCILADLRQPDIDPRLKNIKKITYLLFCHVFEILMYNSDLDGIIKMDFLELIKNGVFFGLGE